MTQKIRVCSPNDLADNQSVKFTIPTGKFNREGFVIFRQGHFFAYYNECAHVSIALDWDDNDFFSLDFTRLVCKNHGAEFVPESGLCTAGPCTGASLKSIPLEITDDGVFALIGQS